MELLIFFIAIVALIYVVYSTAVYFKTNVPYVKTPKERLPLILVNLDIDQKTVIYDLGCGTGTFLFAAEKYHPQELIGFELSPWHFLIAKVSALLKKSKAKIYFKDFLKVNFSEADIVYIFLTIPTQKLAEKIITETKRGCQIISLGAPIPHLPITKEIALETTGKKTVKAYLHLIK